MLIVDKVSKKYWLLQVCKLAESCLILKPVDVSRAKLSKQTAGGKQVLRVIFSKAISPFDPSLWSSNVFGAR